jgi:hypothetical protein
MSKPRVYIETTIPSFYHETRTAPDIIARRRWTRQSWFTSPPVLDELGGGPRERVVERLTLVPELPLLAIEPGIDEIVQAYVRHKLMPADRAGGNLELSDSRERKQVRPYSPNQHYARAVRSYPCHLLGTTGRQ